MISVCKKMTWKYIFLKNHYTMITLIINAIKTKSNCPGTYVCLTFDYRCHNYNIFQDKIFAWIPRQMLCLDARYIHT